MYLTFTPDKAVESAVTTNQKLSQQSIQVPTVGVDVNTNTISSGAGLDVNTVATNSNLDSTASKAFGVRIYKYQGHSYIVRQGKVYTVEYAMQQGWIA